MTTKGVILYGPPTSGKDTITAELTRQDTRFTLLPKLKAGTGRSRGYRAVTAEELEKLRADGRLPVETARYGNVYAVDRQDVETIAASGRIPVVHMGNVADLTRLRDAVPLDWLAVLLWIPREVCAERSAGRGDADTADRLRAWDETRTDLDEAGTGVFDLEIRTDEVTPSEAARRIITAAG
ncbi:phosphotransferase-like protein [Actinocorallia sp. A-T 12471]|uniref:phosphotransferase-like protein n=1 Tax=Actinocorallia sp. A-T 12471 TaxID=3089813 RepID=UPI0029D3989C|nr:guanylate kinase [Actinocorallia sp. A-T 12471]MDX6744988.1 guanylate kinase [Actinocorallia sp. A-T 12471]